MVTPSYDRVLRKLHAFKHITYELSQLSTCKRLSVGAIVFPRNFSRVVSIGYNGPPRGLPNDSCTNIEGACGCVHAEANAIVKLGNIRTQSLVMFSTFSPCASCAGLIVNDGRVRTIIYDLDYRSQHGVDVLGLGNLIVKKLEGLTIDNLREWW